MLSLAQFKADSHARRLAEKPPAPEPAPVVVRGAEELKIFKLVRGAPDPSAPRCS